MNGAANIYWIDEMGESISSLRNETTPLTANNAPVRTRKQPADSKGTIMKTALIRLDYIFAIVHADRNQAAQPDRRRRQRRWPIKPVRDLARQMGDELETRTLIRAGIMLTPLIALAAAFG